MLQSFLRVKPRSHFQREAREERLERSYTLFDLLCVGVGGTVGSGIFVLNGLIARDFAGPFTPLCWIIAGAACCLSASSYAELSVLITSSGSSYAYAYSTLGELPAFISAACLSLEYGVSGAAVARSWGDKLAIFLGSSSDSTESGTGGGVWGYINVSAGLLQAACCILLLLGVSVGKLTVNFFTVLKMFLVMFIVIAGFCAFDQDILYNNSATALASASPSSSTSSGPSIGFASIMRGATSCFFGFVGYDEVCCMASETRETKSLPRAVFGTIAVCSVFYCLAALALVGMQDYREISRESGFSEAFSSLGDHWFWASSVVAVGELVTLPLVVLVSFLAQPRLQLAMAKDGLLPKAFGDIDSRGNLFKGIAISGLLCSLIALFIPFLYIEDAISAGVLLSFNITNSALITLRRGQNVYKAKGASYCSQLLALFHVFAILSSTLLTRIASLDPETSLAQFVLCSVFGGLFVIASLHTSISISSTLPPPNTKSSSIASMTTSASSTNYRVAGVPFVPCLGIFVNYYLLAQLSFSGMVSLVVYFAFAVIMYLVYGRRNSVLGSTGGELHTTQSSSSAASASGAATSDSAVASGDDDEERTPSEEELTYSKVNENDDEGAEVEMADASRTASAIDIDSTVVVNALHLRK